MTFRRWRWGGARASLQGAGAPADERPWLEFSLPSALLTRLDFLHVLLWWGLLLLGTAALALVVVRRLTAPIRHFPAAAERLGLDIAASPLAATGPAALRAAAEAINAMQGRRKRFVDDRTGVLAAISHDLRTPISRLRLRVEGLPESADRGRLTGDLKLMEEMLGVTWSSPATPAGRRRRDRGRRPRAGNPGERARARVRAVLPARYGALNRA